MSRAHIPLNYIPPKYDHNQHLVERGKKEIELSFSPPLSLVPFTPMKGSLVYTARVLSRLFNWKEKLFNELAAAEVKKSNYLYLV